LPTASKHALENHYLEPWETLGGDAWPLWLEGIDRFCGSIATLINAEDREICPQANLASGFSAYLTAIAKLPENAKNRVILMHQDAFASMGFVVSSLMQTYQLTLILIEDDPNNLEAWKEALANNKVLACLFTHVHSNTSVKSDIPRLVQLAHQYNTYALVDIAQSVGVVPVDVSFWKADAIFGSCVKWLCGGPGAGFMYVKGEQLARLDPDPVGWFSHQNPFEFDINNYQAADTAKRFWGGTPSVSAYITAHSSIEMMLEIGIENVAQHNLDLKRHLLNSLPESVLIKPTMAGLEHQGGTLCIGSDNMHEVAKNLSKAGVRFDRRGDIFRLSLHIINTTQDARQIAACFERETT
jgi:selenocysteine lyase/cysteine desulfurase